MKKILVAGIGNTFLGDDGFGVEVVARLRRAQLPPAVRVMDVGIRSRDLAFELCDGGYEFVILVDAAPRGGAAGTVYLIDPGLTTEAGAAGVLDPHGADLRTLMPTVRLLGGEPPRLLLVGCEPATLEEGIGLSAPVAAAVDEGVALVCDLLRREGVDVPGGEPAAVRC